MTFYDTAKQLQRVGISTIPCKAGKLAAIKWGDYEARQPTDGELVDWFELDQPVAMALIGGRVNCLDFDEKYSAGIFHRYQVRADETGLGGLVRELLRQRTPSGGYHLVWICESNKPIRSLKLASKANHETMVETRGAGGYFLISPSPGYEIEAGSFSDIPKISVEDRDALLDLARTFDERERPKEVGPTSPLPAVSGESPADDYDRNADVPALLRKHGWKPAGRSDKYWTRPGKERGVSATWNVVPGRFYVFSSSTSLEQGHVYRPAWLYAALECGGDYAKAAGELRRQGFGGVRANHAPKTLTQYIDDAEIVDMQIGPAEHDDPTFIEGVDPSGQAPTTESEDDRIRRMLHARRFDPSIKPPEIRVVFTIKGSVVSTVGNLTAIVAPPKVGKTAYVSAIVAATMTPNPADVDLLGVVGYNARGLGVLMIDTEQAPDDFWHSVNRSRQRARTEAMPDWLEAYTVADLPAPIARRAVGIKMADMAEQHGGLWAIIIDGVADLVLDVNDAAECNALVAELHGLAIRHSCAIVCVLHLNPGSDKARGHLGSQIERKAESNLKIDKDDAVSIVWSNKQRRAPIDKAFGPRFAWSDDAKMHVTIAGDDTGMTRKDQRKVMEWVEIAQSVFRPGVPPMPWTALAEALQEARRTANGAPSPDTVRRWINEMKRLGIISVSFGSYSLSQVISDTKAND